MPAPDLMRAPQARAERPDRSRLWWLGWPLLQAWPLQARAQAQPQPRPRIVLIPKLVGIAYYDAVKQGVDEAARELPDVEVEWIGPAQAQVLRQVELIDALLKPRPPALIAVATNDPVSIVPALERARAAGVRLMSWDADNPRREFFVNLVDYDGFGTALAEALHDQVPAPADIAIVTTTFTAPNQLRWVNAFKRALRDRGWAYRLLDIRPAGENTEEAGRVASSLLRMHPGLRAIVALGTPNLPGVAQAVRDAGAAGRIAVIGNSTPRAMREYLKDGTVRVVLLWNARDHGYLTVHAARQLLRGGFGAGRPFTAGRLGSFTPQPDEQNLQVALPVLRITRDNVDSFDF